MSGKSWVASGVAISGDGNTVVLGAPLAAGNTGGAWVYTRALGVWSQGVKLTPSDAVGSPQQGFTVAISGDGTTIAVGGWRDNIFVGAIWIFTRNNGVWTQQGPKLTPGPGTSELASSLAISTDGNTVLAGAGGADTYLAPGCAWVFVRSNGTWTRQAKLTDATASGAAIGSAVALSSDGSTAAVGGFVDSVQIGAVWVFTRANGVWTQQGPKLVGTGASGKAWQGSAVSLSADGNTMLVGGPYDNFSTGAVWVFTRQNGLWTQQGGKLVGTGSQGQQFQGIGLVLSGEGNTAIVGATSPTRMPVRCGSSTAITEPGRNRAASSLAWTMTGRHTRAVPLPFPQMAARSLRAASEMATNSAPVGYS